jgi:TonB family protein
MTSATLFATAMIAGALAIGPQTQEPPLKPGNGVTMPALVQEVKPSYTADAMKRGVTGVVMLEAVVEIDGSVGDVRVLKPLDDSLDGQAVAAVKKWQFKPGTREGKPVRVRVEVEMSFTLRGGLRLDSDSVFKPGVGVIAPAVLKEVKPEYTAAAREAGIQCIVTLECVVDADGRVGDTRVTKSLDPDLDKQARAALRQWIFKPGERDGKPVPVQVFVEINFTLK